MGQPVCNWQELEPYLLEKVFGNLNTKDRYCSVALVCQHWRAVNEQHPEKLVSLHMDGPPKHVSFLKWILRVAGGLEEIIIGDGEYNLITRYNTAQMLTIVALHSPKLRRLSLGDSKGSAVLHSVAMMGGLQKLRLYDLNLGGDDATQSNLLCGLTSLTELNVSLMLCSDEAAEPIRRNAAEFWSCLAPLTRLKKLKILWTVLNILENPAEIALIQHISMVTQLERLTIDLAEDDHPRDSIGALTNLTKLSLRSPLPASELGPIQSLPRLQNLEVQIFLDNAPPSPLVAGQGITRLRLACVLPHMDNVVGPTTLQSILPPTAPALARLQELALDGFDLPDGQLAVSVMRAMTSLTFLRLSRSGHEHVPPALTAVPSLRVLVMAFNQSFQLWAEDVATLAGLPRLETLKLTVEGGIGLSCASVNVLSSLRARLPVLEVLLEDAVDPLSNNIRREKGRAVWARGLLGD